MKQGLQKYLLPMSVMLFGTFLIFSSGSPALSSPQANEVYYTCPMPEHADVALDKPGKCPKCGMNLEPKPISAITYVCPMKEDADVIAAKPGKCPKCGMELVAKKAALVQFICPMKQDAVVAAKPGKCPKCGMQLVPEQVPH